jgi:hypothetical protein
LQHEVAAGEQHEPPRCAREPYAFFTIVCLFCAMTNSPQLIFREDNAPAKAGGYI